ncbi:MAG: hypothetical protein ACO21C_06580 [Burkholderiaceae bacterium]
MKITFRRLERQYELPADHVVRVVPMRDIGAHSPMTGLCMGFVLGRPVVIAEPSDLLGEGVGPVSVTGESRPSGPMVHDEVGLVAAWAVVLQANGDCHQAVFADQVDWKHKDEA